MWPEAWCLRKYGGLTSCIKVRHFDICFFFICPSVACCYVIICEIYSVKLKSNLQTSKQVGGSVFKRWIILSTWQYEHNFITVRSFVVIRNRISDPRSLRSWYLKRPMNPLWWRIYQLLWCTIGLSDLGSFILIQFSLLSMVHPKRTHPKLLNH